MLIFIKNIKIGLLFYVIMLKKGEGLWGCIPLTDLAPLSLKLVVKNALNLFCVKGYWKQNIII